MLLEAVEMPITYRWPGGEVRLEPGKPIDLPQDRAAKLLAKAAGKVRMVAAAWPRECLESERKFGTPEAKLYPLLNKNVLTPGGVGILRQVFSGLTAVVLEDHPERIRFFDPVEVVPCPDDP